MNPLKKLALWAAQKAASYGALFRGALDIRDMFWIGGLISVFIGLSQIYIPVAWIVCGAAVFWMGVRR